MNNLTNELKNYFRQISYTLLTACMLLAIGVSGVQAQDDDDPPVPDPMPAVYFFKVGDVKTNEITLAPGENFTLKVGFTLIGPCDGGTTTLLWNQDELLVPGTQVTNLTGTLLPFNFWNVITQDIGHLSFTQGILGGYLLPPPDGQGGYLPTDYMFMEFQVNVPEGSTWSSSNIRHQVNSDTVDYSILAFYGASLVDYDQIPTFTVYNSDAADVDCEDLGLNIGDACEDGDDSTENDTVTADCECVGTPLPLLGCETTSQFGSANVAGPDTIQISSCTYFGEYSVISGVISGYEYEFTGQESTSGNLAFITVRSDSSNGPVLAAGVSPVTVTSTSAANLYVHWNADSDCGTASSCAVTTAACITCATVPDCEGVPGGSALPGTSCDDGDAGTINDVYDADCNCAGELPTLGSVCESAFALDCNADPATYSSANSNGTNTTTCFIGNNGLWFSFMGTGGDITVNSTASFDHAMSINTGSCDDLVNVGCKDASTLAETFTIASSVDGQMYYVYIARYNSESTTTGDITIDIDCATPPACTAPDLTFALVDVDSNPIEGGCLEQGSEFYLIATLAGGSGNDSYIISANDEDTQEIDANEAASFGPYAIGTSVSVTAVGVQDDDCDVSGTADSPAICAPSNDDCANATAIACGGSVAGSTFGATESDLGTASCAGGTPADVFYTFEAAAGQEITVTLVGDDYDAVLAIYSGPCDDLTELDCADNGFSAGVEETITYTATEAGTITIRTYDWSSSGGSFTLSVSCEDVVVYDCPALNANIGDACDDDNGMTENDTVNADCECVGTPVAGVDNDDCETAVALACGDSVEGSTNDATWSGQTDNCTFQDNPDVYYSLDVIAGTEYTVTVSGDDFDAVVAAYTNSCDSLTKLICADNEVVDGGVESITWTAISTETVTIRTYDWSSTGGSFTISVSCADGVDCPALNANIGDACDDDNGMTENDTVNADCECVGTPIEVVYDCPQIEANYGEACTQEDGSEGVINTSCDCVPAPSCENYTYYLADHAAADGISTIYEVTLSGGVATMTYIATSDIEVHIAFNAVDNKIYAVSKHENSYRTLNPLSGIWGDTVMLGMPGADYGEITAAVFAPNGKLVFGSQDQNAIFSVNVMTDNMVSPYDSYSPVTGGDLAYTSDGMLYMATRSGNGLYEVYPAPVSDILLGNLPVKVTGLAATDSDQLLLSAQGMMSLELYNLDGSNASSYALTLDGAPYTLRDGDLASGCNTGETTSDCDNYATFYVNHGPDVDGSDLYTVDFVGGNAELTLVTNVDFEAHIGYNSDEELMYFVNKDGSSMTIYNVGTSTFVGSLPILGGIDQLTAVAYNAADGKLYVGDANSDVIASIDLTNGIAAFYANAPVFGGDLTFLDGTLYLARRSVSELYEIVPFGDAILLGSIPEGVNGMAPAPNAGNLVTSSAAQNAFVEISAADGSTITTWPAMIGDTPFTFINGDMASGCIDDLVGPGPLRPIQDLLQSELTAYPNPTSGPSIVVFTTAETGRTLVEVYDMSGRSVATLFNQEAQQGKEYRLDFNGAALPNGVYIYRMTTQNETIIEKFMIAK